MAANDFAAQNGTEKLSTNALTTVNGTTVTADLIEVQRVKVGFGVDGALTDVSTTAPLPAVALQNSVVSIVNSATAPLLLGAAFVGTAEDVTEYSQIVVSVFASHASAVDGLQLQQSHDNVNWDFVNSYTIPATAGKTFSVAVLCKFFRVMYTNGGVMQTAFRMATIYSKHVKKGSSVRAEDGRSNDNDFEETLAYQMSYDGTNWNRQRGNIANGLLTDVSRIVAALPVGANVIGALTANQSVNTAQIGGVSIAVGSGVSGANVQRVVLATDVFIPAISEMRAANLHITATAAVNTALTATLPAPAAGLFHYITSIQMVKLYSVLGVAAGAGVVVTSTNLPGSPAWLTQQAAGAVGTVVEVIDYRPATPLKSSAAAVATTIVAPAQLQSIWRINVSYFTAP